MPEALLNFDDFRNKAKRRLPRGLFDYIDRGAEDEKALVNLRRSFDKVRLSPRILRGVGQPKTELDYFDKNFSYPLVISPTALAGLVAYQGEVKLARAAGRLNIPYVVATQSVNTVEEIKEGAPDTQLWFQLYIWKSRKLTHALLERAQASGITTLIVTVDGAAHPKREYNMRNGFALPFKPSLKAAIDMLRHPYWFLRVFLPYWRQIGILSYGHYPQEFRHNITAAVQFEEVKLEYCLHWDDITALRRVWPGRILVKGILNEEDAVMAQDRGMDGIVVSAHGGRYLDIAVTPMDVLEAIALRVGSRMAIFVDSGVRRGSDIVHYLARGAKAVFLGRAPLWGLAAGDEAGADNLLEILLEELCATMRLLGCANYSDLRNLQRFS